jgi:hypothetical protein
MTAHVPIITFEGRKGDPNHREFARIGYVEVGYVIDLASATGPAVSHWSTYLPTETARDLKSAPSRCEAKRALVLRIAEWFECLGPQFADIADLVRAEVVTIMDLS